MNCTSFRKYVGAFADGELDVAQNLEALEHLNMCRNCAAHVANITKLKAAIGRIYGHRETPSALREKVLAALDTADRGSSLEATGDLQASSHPTHRLMAPLGVAAAILVSVTVWQIWPAPAPQTRPVTVVPGQIVRDVRTQHQRCLTNRGSLHHAADLPRTPSEIERILSEELKLKVLAPNLTAHGFELIGADRCGILGRSGAHLLYRSVAGPKALSIFTIAHLGWLRSTDHPTDSKYAYISGNDDRLTVLAWHDGPQTYVTCGDLPAADLRRVMDSVRVASAINGQMGAQFALAAGPSP